MNHFPFKFRGTIRYYNQSVTASQIRKLQTAINAGLHNLNAHPMSVNNRITFVNVFSYRAFAGEDSSLKIFAQGKTYILVEYRIGNLVNLSASSLLILLFSSLFATASNIELYHALFPLGFWISHTCISWLITTTRFESFIGGQITKVFPLAR